jgi:hypothetical protein
VPVPSCSVDFTGEAVETCGPAAGARRLCHGALAARGISTTNLDHATAPANFCGPGYQFQTGDSNDGAAPIWCERIPNRSAADLVVAAYPRPSGLSRSCKPTCRTVATRISIGAHATGPAWPQPRNRIAARRDGRRSGLGGCLHSHNRGADGSNNRQLHFGGTGLRT